MSYMAIHAPLVRLTADGYSVPKGTLGTIDDEHERIKSYSVAWVTGSSSVPVHENDLEEVGMVRVRAPEVDKLREQVADLRGRLKSAAEALGVETKWGIE